MTPEEKIEQLRLICQAAPDDHLSRYMLGLELNKAKRHDEAAEALERAAALKPDHTASYRHWGDALRKAGRPAEAIRAYREGVRVSRETGDMQAGKEMETFLRKLEREAGGDDA